MRRTVAALLLTMLAAGCAAPYDSDGEVGPAGALVDTPVQDPDTDARSIVVDTDLGGDDLVALAFLLKHPDVRVEAVTIAATGLVGCDPGVDLVADLFVALDERPVPVACGREDPGPAGRSLPQEWRDQAATGTGLPRSETTLEPAPEPAAELIGQLAAAADEAITVVALGPLTNLADLAERLPQDYARLAGVHAMAGALEVTPVEGVTEWNAAADPDALAAVLVGPAPVTVVPDDPIPPGKPDALDAPVVGSIASVIDYPKWWDLVTAAALVAPGAVETETGAWSVDDSGRLERQGAGPVRVVRGIDADALDDEFAQAFGRTTADP